jgi:hypothetical protein
MRKIRTFKIGGSDFYPYPISDFADVSKCFSKLVRGQVPPRKPFRVVSNMTSHGDKTNGKHGFQPTNHFFLE